MEQAVLGVALGSECRLLVVAHHLRRTAHQDLAIRRDTAAHAGDRGADVTDAYVAAQAEVRNAEVLRHPVALEQLQAQLAVPVVHGGRQRRRARQAGVALIEAERAEDLRAHRRCLFRVGKGGGLDFRRNPPVDAVVELAPQARHRHEDGRPGASQVLGESLQAFVEEHPAAAVQRNRLDHRALRRVRQRQVGQQAIRRAAPATLVVHHLGDVRPVEHAAETVHDALGTTGAAGGVDDGGERLARRLHNLGQRLHLGDDLLPGRTFATRRARQIDQRQGSRHNACHLVPAGAIAIQAADEHEPHIRVLEHIAHGVGVGAGVDRYADMARHPDGQVGDDPVRAVLGEDTDGRVRRQLQRCQVSRHAPGLVANLAPAVVDHAAVGTGLGQVDRIGSGAFPMQELVQ
ncbi:hypothetical protein D3C81_1051980 [compost metagenome]